MRSLVVTMKKVALPLALSFLCGSLLKLVEVLTYLFQYTVGLSPNLVRLPSNERPINSNGLLNKNKSFLISLKTLLNRGCKSSF